jgi:SAM-dependent methyltransferase
LPFADDRFSGAVSFSFLHHVPTLALQDQLFAGLARILRAGGVLVVFDGVTTPGIAALHAGLPCNPIDPGTLESRLLAADFVSVKVRTLASGGLRMPASRHSLTTEGCQPPQWLVRRRFAECVPLGDYSVSRKILVSWTNTPGTGSGHRGWRSGRG